MLLKLKSQFEELRSRVVFLECVKKYLEVETKLLVRLLILTTPAAANIFLCAWRFWTWTDGVWRFHCCPLWLSMDLVLWIFSPLRTRHCFASVPAEERVPFRVDLLSASWLTFTQGSEPFFCFHPSANLYKCEGFGSYFLCAHYKICAWNQNVIFLNKYWHVCLGKISCCICFQSWHGQSQVCSVTFV